MRVSFAIEYTLYDVQLLFTDQLIVLCLLILKLNAIKMFFYSGFLDSFLDFFLLLITFANSLDPNLEVLNWI